jgi:hypothetical protein
MQKLDTNTVALGMKIDMKLSDLPFDLLMVYFPVADKYIRAKYNKLTCFSQVAIGMSGRAFLGSC